MRERKVIVITGAGSGIGKELALQSARKGWAVIAVSRLQSHIDDLVKEIVNDGGTCVGYAIDITRPEVPARIVDIAQQRFGRIDVIINMAGFATSGKLLEQSDAEIDAQWQVHFAAPIRIMRAAFPMLLQSKGQVFFTGSGLARVPSPYYGAYCAAKAAVRAGVTQLRRELNGTGVAVTYIDPGSVRTNFANEAGIPSYGPAWVVAHAKDVAAKILKAIDSRPRRVNGVWWHTFLAMLGEWFPSMTDRSMKNAPVPQRRTISPIETEAAQTASDIASATAAELTCHGEVSNHGRGIEANLDQALEPVARRMERVKLPKSFLVELLRPGDDVHLGDAAMRWAGMPNKNERAALAEALDALTTGGFLERTGDESWRVLRAP